MEIVHFVFGGPAPDTGMAAFSDGASQNYEVDERAEVGLISRNVELTSTISAGRDDHSGGEIRILKGYKAVDIQGVELQKFGKDRLGSYPIHFHRVGTPTGTTLINSNSIDHSYNHCITVHSTNNLTISNNVCARIVDHIFYMESGKETGNSFIDNLGIGAMSNALSIPASNASAKAAFWSGDYLASKINYDGFNIQFTDNQNLPVHGSSFTPSGFWITDPGANIFKGNSIAGCQDQGRGFWMLPASTANAEIPLPKGNFASNRAHGCYTGFDTAKDIGVTGAHGYIPQTTCIGGSDVGKKKSCDAITEFDDLTATRDASWVKSSGTDSKTNPLARDGSDTSSSMVTGDSAARGVSRWNA